MLALNRLFELCSFSVYSLRKARRDCMGSFHPEIVQKCCAEQLLHFPMEMT